MPLLILTEEIHLKKGVRQGSAISQVLFNAAIYSATKHIHGSYFLDGVDLSFISYAVDLLLLSSSLSLLKENLELLVNLYKDIGLRVNISETEFVVFKGTDSARTLLSVGDGPAVARSETIKYLGIQYGSDIRMLRGLVSSSAYRGMCTGYAKAVTLKNTVSKMILAKLFNAMVTPHFLYISPLFDLLT